MRPLPLLLLLACSCGPAPTSSTSAADLVAVDAGQDAPPDAGPDAPSWCQALSESQTRCNVDPYAACEAHNGMRPTSAFSCGSWADPSDAGCVGFPVCTLLVFCE